MSDLERFQEFVDWFHELVWGTKRERPKIKRARGPKGRYKGDDLSTAFTNEAWVGGKAPKKSVMSNKERNALDKAMRKANKMRKKNDKR